MIYLFIFFGSFIIFSQTSASNHTKHCEICIIDSSCTDDKIYFNVSISKHCQVPLDAHFTYHTDVNSKPNHYNTTGSCSNCFISIEIEPVHDAWDYTLTLKLPEPSEHCRTQYTAHCGGEMSKLSWYITGGLSGLTVMLGGLVCFVRRFRGKRKQLIMKKKKMVIAAINV